ncbi:MAG: tyrosine-type recombinase/integrase [Rhizobacter sp.]|nr:tyrosine-type recombinase/integrase [Rhizobacter sp.]
MLAIQPYAGTRTARALNWVALNDEALRRAATLAANTRDTAQLWELTEAYITLSASRPVSPYTLRNYRHAILRLLEVWQGENLLRPSRHAAATLALELRERGLAPGTIQLQLASGRALYKALRWAGATDAAPFADVKSPHDPTPPEEKRAAYSDADITAMLEAAGAQDRALILLGAHGGLRISEALALEWAAVNLNAGTLRVNAGKGGKARTITLSSALRVALEAWRTESRAEGRVLPYCTATRARQRLQVVCHAAGVAYLGAHSLRHSCGTRLAAIAGDLRVAAKHLGHASTTTTQTYAKMNHAAYAEAIAQL